MRLLFPHLNKFITSKRRTTCLFIPTNSLVAVCASTLIEAAKRTFLKFTPIYVGNNWFNTFPGEIIYNVNSSTCNEDEKGDAVDGGCFVAAIFNGSPTWVKAKLFTR